MKRQAETQLDTNLTKKIRDPNTLDDIQALFKACIEDNANLIDKLLQKTSFITLNNQGLNALYLIGHHGSIQVSENIINNYLQSADINIKWIAIGAAEGGHIELLEYILKSTRRKGIKISYNQIATKAALSGQQKIIRIYFRIYKERNFSLYYYI